MSEDDIFEVPSDSEGEVEFVKMEPVELGIFVNEDGSPVAFMFHESVKKVDESRQLRKALQRAIEKNGGIVVHREEEADTLLISKNHEFTKTQMQAVYDGLYDQKLSRIYVEYTDFVNRCIRKKAMAHAMAQINSMSGVPPGRRRTQFTSKDVERLCEYIAMKIPEKEAGGRFALSFYQELLQCAEVDPQKYVWAKRHTAESWKEKYKKHQYALDKEITRLARLNPPSQKQLRRQDRRLNKTRNGRRAYYEDQDNEDDDVMVMEDKEAQQLNDIDLYLEQGSRRVGSSSPVKSPANNKARQTRHPNDQELFLQRNARGREKAQEEPGESDDGDYDFSFEVDDRIPSLTPRSPDRTLVASARTEPSVDPSNHATQNTLVGTQRMIPSNDKQAPSQPNRSSQTSRRLEQKAASPLFLNSPAPAQSSSVRSALRTSQPSPVQVTQQPQQQKFSHPVKAARRRPVVLVPPTPSQPSPSRTGNVEPVIASPPAAKVVRPKRTLVMPSSPIDASAPYRNTRQMSRSVEPAPMAAQVAKSKSVNNRKRKAPEAIPEEDSDVADDVPLPPRRTRASSRLRSVEPKAAPAQQKRNARKKQKESIPEENEKHDEENNISGLNPPTGQTLDEEMDVENLLAIDSEDISAGPTRKDDRENSMDTDDVHISRGLKQAGSVSSSLAPSKKFNFLTQSPSDILKRAHAQTQATSRRHSMLPNRKVPLSKQTTPPQTSQAVLRKPRQSVPTFMRRDVNMRNTPRTPVRQSQRDSSEESFPLPGTHAKEMADMLEQREKGTPYQPPAGTQAARLAYNDN